MHIDAIVIRKEPRREDDQRIILYTRQAGKVSVVARGSLKGASRQRSALDEGNLIRGELVPSRSGMPILTGAQARSCWHRVKSSPPAWAAAQFFLEAADALVFDSQPDEALWGVLIGALEGLETAGEILPEFRVRQAALMEILGYGTPAVPAAAPVRTPLDERFEHLAQRRFASLDLLYGLTSGGESWYRKS